jgi:hypothetical protein
VDPQWIELEGAEKNQAVGLEVATEHGQVALEQVLVQGYPTSRTNTKTIFEISIAIQVSAAVLDRP